MTTVSTETVPVLGADLLRPSLCNESLKPVPRLIQVSLYEPSTVDGSWTEQRSCWHVHPASLVLCSSISTASPTLGALYADSSADLVPAF